MGEPNMSADRCAVAELVEADRAYDTALAELKEHYQLVAEHGYIAARTGDAREIATRFVAAEIRRQRALDRMTQPSGGKLPSWVFLPAVVEDEPNQGKAQP